MDPLEEFNAKFRVQELLVERFGHWSWSVRPAQSTLGSTVLSLNRYARNFCDVNRDEMAELEVVVSTIEKASTTAFSYDKINYLMLMMNDPHVHFHVMLRYGSTRSFAGAEWKDAGWPGVPALSGDAPSVHVLSAVREHLKSNL